MSCAGPAVGALLLAAGPVAAAPKAPCGAPAPLVKLGVTLPNTARAIRRGHEVVIVAIGSSSTQGIGASSPAYSYPAVLADELQTRWPRLSVRVINKGIGGETADQMLARFDRDVLAHRPHLVIWQLGSNSVLKGQQPDTYPNIVRKGVDMLRRARADIVLMDPQYAPRLLDRPVHRRMIDTIGAVANDLKVAVFHRFEVMRHWVDSGQYRFEDVLAQDRLHMNDVSYGCIARLLAGALDRAAQATPISPAEAAAAGRM